MYVDRTGYFAITTLLICAGIGAIVGGGLGAYLGYQKTGSFNLEYIIAGAITGALLAAGGYMLWSTTISLSSSVLVAKYGFTKAGIGMYLGLQTFGSGYAQYQSNKKNGDPLFKGLIGSSVGGLLGSGLNWISPGIAGASSAMINEFENELFYDDDSEYFSWTSVGKEFAWFAGANYVQKISMFSPTQSIVTNSVFDYIAIRNSK